MIREIKFYKNYFLDFYSQQNGAIQEKIEFILDLIRRVEIIPIKFLKKIEEERRQKEKAIKGKAEAIEREKELAIKFARQLNKFGISINEISSETGIDIDMLKKIL